jgi:hypothetical protein
LFGCVLIFATARAQVAPGCDDDGFEMTSRWGSKLLRNGAIAMSSAAGACALVLVVSALAQEARPPAQIPPQAPTQVPNQAPNQAPLQAQNQPQGPAAGPAPSQAPADANPAFRPGFIDVFGRWLEQGASKFKSDMQGAQESMDKLGSQARDAAKDATGTVIGLPNARAMTGRERCTPAGNGAPDCPTAAVALCRGKGFQTGRSLDTQSEQKCPTKLLLEGRAPNNTECPTEIFVTRAMCQ